MKRPSSPQQWSRRRTEALLSLFKTPAPPDFRAQVLARVHERHHLSAASYTSQDPFTGRWQQCSTWLWETILRTPRCTTLAPAAGSVCVLLLSGALLWWTCVPGGGPTPPRVDGSLAGVPAPEAPGLHQDERLAGARDSQAQQPLVATPPAPVDTVLPHALQQTTDDSTAAGDMPCQEPAWLPPTIPLLQNANDPPPLIKTEPQRVHAKRALPAKPKRAKKGQGLGKPVSASGSPADYVSYDQQRTRRQESA